MQVAAVLKKIEDKKTSLIIAKNTAYQKYLYYRQKAIEEARDEINREWKAGS